MGDPIQETDSRLYFSIREVSELLGVKAHVLRYWESQFPSLRPKKGRSGNRMYRPKDIDALRSIKELLYERRYTIAGARRRLSQKQPPPLEVPSNEEVETEPIPQLELEFLSPDHRAELREIRRELVSLRRLVERGGRSEISVADTKPGH